MESYSEVTHAVKRITGKTPTNMGKLEQVLVTQSYPGTSKRIW